MSASLFSHAQSLSQSLIQSQDTEIKAEPLLFCFHSSFFFILCSCTDRAYFFDGVDGEQDAEEENGKILSAWDALHPTCKKISHILK